MANRRTETESLTRLNKNTQQRTHGRKRNLLIQFFFGIFSAPDLNTATEAVAALPADASAAIVADSPIQASRIDANEMRLYFDKYGKY